jgi:hypothetical protein
MGTRKKKTADTLKWKKFIYMLSLLLKVKKCKKISDWKVFWFATGVNDTGDAPYAVRKYLR